MKTLKTVEEKRAFLGLAAYRYVYSINPNVFADFAVALLKDEDAGVRLAAVKGIDFSRGMAEWARIKGDSGRIEADVDAVAALMTEKDSSLRGAAMACVGGLEGAKYAEALVEAVEKDPADEARAGAGAGLVRLASGTRVPVEVRRVALATATRHLGAGEKQVVMEAILGWAREMGDLECGSLGMRWRGCWGGRSCGCRRCGRCGV